MFWQSVASDVSVQLMSFSVDMEAAVAASFSHYPQKYSDTVDIVLLSFLFNSQQLVLLLTQQHASTCDCVWGHIQTISTNDLLLAT